MNVLDTLKEIGVDIARHEGRGLDPRSPIDGQPTVGLRVTTLDEASAILERANAAFLGWRTVPAPVRGELVRRFGNELRNHKAQLARLVTIEAGKVTQEALGEVQEMIDICDFAVGLSRQLHGLTIASERPGHHMRETWHPMGVCGVITAFNFPVAVWAWNAALALVCGNAVVWKPSEKTPLTALAVQAIFERVAADFDDAPVGLSGVLLGSQELGRMLADDARVAIVSATGSTAMGGDVSRRVAQRFGRCILELSGNNAAIVTPAADLDLAVRAILFAAVGTTGQRCTTLRRAIAHSKIADHLVDRLKKRTTMCRSATPSTREFSSARSSINARTPQWSQRCSRREKREVKCLVANVWQFRIWRMVITSGRRSSKCRVKAIWSVTRRSRRSYTCCATGIWTRPLRSTTM